MIELLPLEGCYYELGEGLGLSEDYLGIIRDSRNPLKEVVMAWLQRQYDMQKFGQPTWRMLVKTVDNLAGGKKHQLAKEIAANHTVGEYYVIRF